MAKRKNRDHTKISKKATKRKRVAKPRKKASKPKSGSRAKLFSFKDLNGVHQKLTLKQKLFCIEYLQNYGNSSQAIIEAGYDVYYRDKQGNKTDRVNYNLVRVMAAENLTKPNILAFIRMKYAEFGYDDDNVEIQHLFLINQNANLSTKQRAIADYYKLKGRYPVEKTEETIIHKFEEMDDSQLDEAINELD